MAKQPTVHERMVAFLLAKGGVEQKSGSRKYRKFMVPSGDVYWVGKMGALRKGRTISSSFSVSLDANKFLAQRGF